MCVCVWKGRGVKELLSLVSGSLFLLNVMSWVMKGCLCEDGWGEEITKRTRNSNKTEAESDG